MLSCVADHYLPFMASLSCCRCCPVLVSDHLFLVLFLAISFGAGTIWLYERSPSLLKKSFTKHCHLQKVYGVEFHYITAFHCLLLPQISPCPGVPGVPGVPALLWPIGPSSLATAASAGMVCGSSKGTLQRCQPQLTLLTWTAGRLGGIIVGSHDRYVERTHQCFTNWAKYKSGVNIN